MMSYREVNDVREDNDLPRYYPPLFYIKLSQRLSDKDVSLVNLFNNYEICLVPYVLALLKYKSNQSYSMFAYFYNDYVRYLIPFYYILFIPNLKLTALKL